MYKKIADRLAITLRDMGEMGAPSKAQNRDFAYDVVSKDRKRPDPRLFKLARMEAVTLIANFGD
jgi:hypothetical protein